MENPAKNELCLTVKEKKVANGSPKKCFIVSVGTSLITNFNKKEKDKNGKNINSDELGFSTSINSLRNEIKDKCQIFEECQDLTGNSSFKDFNNNLNDFLKTSSDAIKKSAELHSLYGHSNYKPKPESDKIILLPTLTAEGMLCACVLKNHLIKKNGNMDVEIWVIKGLGKAEDPNFQQEGLPNLLNCLNEWIQTFKKESYQIILVPTGGYKAIIPYFVLVGILHKVPLLYVYEDSDLVLELPRIPLGLDAEKWMREKVYIDGIISGGSRLSDIDEDFRPLFVKENDKWKLSPLGVALEDAFRRVTGYTTLQMLTGKTHLLEYLNDDLRQKFQKLVEIGPLLWKGDRLPEMVDHSLKHHYDLFLLAEGFLLPIFKLKENSGNGSFFEGHELFILLCALYLHDCGHVLGRVKHNNTYIRLFPTEIRDYHHILGYERLRNFNDPNYLSQEIYQELKWENDSSNYKDVWKKYQDVWEKYLKAIATVGLFHRKRMPLEENSEPVKCFFWEEDKDGPWNKQNGASFKRSGLKVNGQDLGFERFALLVSLLRIIDSLDNQQTRIGSKMEKDFHLAQLECERKEEEERAEHLGKALSKFNFEDLCINQMDAVIARETDAYAKREGKNENPASSGGTPETNLRDLIGQIREKEAKYLVEEYANAKIRAFFKGHQKEHFEQQSKIDKVLIEHKKEENGTILITLDFEFKGNNSEKEKKLKELEGEYSQAVKGILEANGIKIQYGEKNMQGGG